MKKVVFVFLFFTFSLLNYAQESKIMSNDSLMTNEVPFAVIENVPVYSGCDENMGNPAIKQCMSSQISDLVAKNFNSSLAYTLGLEDGKYRINVIFKINQKGNIIDIRARAPHPYLEKEAIRVIKLIPQMKPGIQDGEAVTVPYSLPILFNVDNSKKNKKSNKKKVVETPDKFPVYRSCSENLDYKNSKSCTTKKIIDFIKVSFDYEMADKAFPLEKSTRFKADFIINKKGKVEQITAKANHKAVAIEVIKLIKRLPKFKKPGYKNGEPVNVPFSVLMTVYF